MVRDGKLGPVRVMNTIHATGHHERYMPAWRRHRELGGGNLIENGTHWYDMWHFFVQSAVEEVFAVSGATEKGNDEPSIVTGRTENGVFLNCVLSDLLPDRNEIEILGQESILHVSLHRFDGLESIPLGSCAGDLRNRLSNMAQFFKTLPHKVLQGRHGGDYNASFRVQWQHFIDCIQQNMPVGCTLEDGRRALQVALAAVQSANTGQPVKVAQAPREILPVVEDDPKIAAGRDK